MTSNKDRKQTIYGHMRREHMTHTTEDCHNVTKVNIILKSQERIDLVTVEDDNLEEQVTNIAARDTSEDSLAVMLISHILLHLKQDLLSC